MWEHPLDQHFRNLYNEKKEVLKKHQESDSRSIYVDPCGETWKIPTHHPETFEKAIMIRLLAILDVRLKYNVSKMFFQWKNDVFLQKLLKQLGGQLGSSRAEAEVHRQRNEKLKTKIDMIQKEKDTLASEIKDLREGKPAAASKDPSDRNVEGKGPSLQSGTLVADERFAKFFKM